MIKGMKFFPPFFFYVEMEGLDFFFFLEGDGIIGIFLA